MPAVMKIQEPIKKVGETASLPDPDLDLSPEYSEKETWYSLMTQLFHAPSALNSLPEAWGRMMGANRGHLVIMLREAGAGHDPFGNAEWPSTPTQVWENLARVEQLPDLNGADFSGVDFKWADLSNADLKGADLTGINFKWAILMDADLSNTDLTGADLRWADLDGADLSNANLAGTDLRWTTLVDANLSHADLRGAIIDGTNLEEANLTGANLTGVNLHSAYLDDETRLDGAIGLEL